MFFLKDSKWVKNLVLLFTIASLITHPSVGNSEIPHVSVSPSYTTAIKEDLSYDAIVNLLDAIESGELEKKCTPEELEEIDNFLTYLAQQGILPEDDESQVALGQDVQKLLGVDNTPFQYKWCFNNNDTYLIVPSILNDHEYRQILQCGFGKSVKKKWNQTKQFVKKHKTEIIVGAVVVVAVVTTAVVVVAATSAATATVVATAASAGAAASANSTKSDTPPSETTNAEIKNTSKEPIVPTTVAQNPYFQAPISLEDGALAMGSLLAAEGVKNLNQDSSNIGISSIDQGNLAISDYDSEVYITPMFESNVYAFKEAMIAQNNLMQDPSDTKSLQERMRNAGAHFTHQLLEEASETIAMAPKLMEEIKETGKMLGLDRLLPSGAEEIYPTDNYNQWITGGHEKIDAVFGTHQANLYTAEAKANNPKNHMEYGELPLPGTFGKFTISKLAKAGAVLDRGGFTKAGRSLMKHGYREGRSVFPKPVGNPAQINAHGQRILEEILNHPQRKVVYSRSRSVGDVIDIYAPEIGGVRYNTSGELIGFLEPKYD